MKNFLEEFESTLTTAKERLESISDEFASSPRAAGKWTRKEILGHLNDSAANNHQRFVRVQSSHGVTLPGYQQDTWVSTQNYQSYGWQQLVSFWHLYNLHVLHVIKHIPEDKLKTTFSLNSETLELEFVIRDYLRHLKHHLAQIFEGLA